MTKGYAIFFMQCSIAAYLRQRLQEVASDTLSCIHVGVALSPCFRAGTDGAMAPTQGNHGRSIGVPLLIISLSLAVNNYTLANLFPYVGVMVKHLMGLSSTNESGQENKPKVQSGCDCC